MVFETNIGLEIHAELSTKTKAYCACRVSFGEEANSNCCPVCMGLPGTLPVLNEKMVEYAVKMGLALNCRINSFSQNARKNYFYPDLPKGYQISQGDKPICQDGYLEIDGRKIRIAEIHIEEDAGKLIHGENVTKIDYNRAGVPLIEIVTEPDLRSCEEVKIFLEKIKNILLYLEISDCKMQEGSLRCDVNVSVREKGQTYYNERCEMKNINSFSSVMRCIRYEEARQKKAIAEGRVIKRETRRWDDEKNESCVMRSKESGADYRYFPEPDLPGIFLTEEYINEVKSKMPSLPDERCSEYVEKYNLSKENACSIVKHKYFAMLFEDAVACGGNPESIAKQILGDISKIVNERNIELSEIPFGGDYLAELTNMTDSGYITVTNAKEVLEIMFDKKMSPQMIVKENNFTQINDVKSLSKLVSEVLKKNENSVSDYRKGKKNAFGYLVGRCMKESGNRANPKIIKEILSEQMGG